MSPPKPNRIALPPVVVPQHLWTRSRKPNAGRAFHIAIPLALVAFGWFSGSSPTRISMIGLALVSFVLIPSIVNARLEKRSQAIAVASQSEAKRLKRTLFKDMLVRLFAPEAWSTLQKAQVYLKLNDGRAAAKWFAETAKLCRRPEAAMLVSAQAHAHVVAGDRKKARELLKKLSKAKLLGPRDQLDLGIVLLSSDLKRNRQAIAYIEAAQKIIGDHPRVIAALALGLQRAERIDEASEMLEKAQICLQDDDDPVVETLVKRARQGLRRYIEAQLRRERRARSRRTTIVVTSEHAVTVSGEIGAGQLGAPVPDDPINAAVLQARGWTSAADPSESPDREPEPEPEPEPSLDASAASSGTGFEIDLSDDEPSESAETEISVDTHESPTTAPDGNATASENAMTASETEVFEADIAVSETDTAASETDTAAPETDTAASEADTAASETDTAASEADTAASETDTAASETDTAASESDTAASESAASESETASKTAADFSNIPGTRETVEPSGDSASLGSKAPVLSQAPKLESMTSAEEPESSTPDETLDTEVAAEKSTPEESFQPSPESTNFASTSETVQAALSTSAAVAAATNSTPDEGPEKNDPQPPGVLIPRLVSAVTVANERAETTGPKLQSATHVVDAGEGFFKAAGDRLKPPPTSEVSARGGRLFRAAPISEKASDQKPAEDPSAQSEAKTHRPGRGLGAAFGVVPPTAKPPEPSGAHDASN